MKPHEHKYISGPIGDECEFCGLLKSTIDRLETDGLETRGLTENEEAIAIVNQIKKLLQKYENKEG